MIILSRSQINKSEGIDITVKSSKGMARLLAPTWELVLSLKRAAIDENAYTAQYLEMLRSLDFPFILQCHCRDEWFCHTCLLIEWLIQRRPDRFSWNSHSLANWLIIKGIKPPTST